MLDTFSATTVFTSGIADRLRICWFVDREAIECSRFCFILQ